MPAKDVTDVARQCEETELVSIVMLTYKRPKFLRDAIASIQRQTLAKWEVVLVHDGDDGETARICGVTAEDEKRVKYFHRERGGNIANAMNFGIEHARGHYIAVLDDDDLWLETDKLAKQVAFLEAQRGVVAVGTGMIVVNTEGVEIMRYLKPTDPNEIRRSSLIANPMAHSTTLYRKGDALAVGGYDESLSGFQDWDFWLKLQGRGRLSNLPCYSTAYRMWPGSGSYRNQRANAGCAIKIVWRHRRNFPRSYIAVPLSLLHGLFSLLPSAIRVRFFEPLSRLKKRLFSSKAAGTG